MTVQLDHTIVQAHNNEESATFLADVLGLQVPVSAGHFVVVRIDHDISFDFCNADGDITPQHYAFRVEQVEFDATFGRINERELPYWADPFRRQPGEIRRRGTSRGFYFEDPSGHVLEVLTSPASAPTEGAVTRGFNHVATLTTDLDRHADFYERVFGATVTFRIEKAPDHPRMFILDFGGGAALNVIEVTADQIVGDRRTAGGRGAIDHFGISVETLSVLEDVKQRLTDAGADIGEIKRLGDEWSLFFRDIDGMELEVCAHTDA
jgi:catechol 2,3-dioxygenase-like lactoylglutathione lyase family enzyme